MDKILTAAASEMGSRSWAARKKKYGEKVAKEMLRDYGSRGGRPKKTPVDKKAKSPKKADK